MKNHVKIIIDNLSEKHPLGLIFIVIVNPSGLNLLAKVNPAYAPTVSANDLMAVATDMANGRGGGSNTFAQGGGTNVEAASAIVDRISKIYQGMRS